MSEEFVRPGVAGPWPALDHKARRVLGVLIEKAKTTPDAYPLTLNALVTGCNQKSNRDPIMELDEGDVEDTLRQLKMHAIVVKVFGGRSERWRHLLYETWNVDKLELAILGVLTNFVWFASAMFLATTRWIPPSAVLVKMWVVSLRRNGMTLLPRSATSAWRKTSPAFAN